MTAMSESCFEFYLREFSAVSELADVPLVAGSTLRIGGDMVIGERMVSSVGAVGIINDSEFY
ncbi:hypothetical protein MSIBF_A3080004 [groundwater metagenome]|uniref:Uncharacterized protein n=1 Tax=groundwater metagenome TaxID=717931 RepID=A0A098EAH4_9ZZZZ